MWLECVQVSYQLSTPRENVKERKTIGQFLRTGHNIPMQQIAEVFGVEHCPIADNSHF